MGQAGNTPLRENSKKLQDFHCDTRPTRVTYSERAGVCSHLMAKATQASDVHAFTDIPNVGKAMAEDFRLLGYRTPQQLAGQDALSLYRRLCVLTKTRQDPCVLDTFLAVVDFMNGGPVQPWWAFTAERKKRFPDL
jgi:hypothetical protein